MPTHLQRIHFIGGGFGSDAGGWYIGPDGKVHHFGGWNPEAISELGHAVRVLREAAQLKTPGVAEAAIKSVMELVQTQLGEHVKSGDVLVVG